MMLPNFILLGLFCIHLNNDQIFLHLFTVLMQPERYQDIKIQVFFILKPIFLFL